MIGKPVLQVLEKCFEAEISGMPAQFPRGKRLVADIHVSSAVGKAVDEGFVEPVRHRMAFNDGLPPMDIVGFALTQRGRIAYCEHARVQP